MLKGVEMARRIWIVSEDTEIDEGVLADASANNCPEIAQGIPPSLSDILTEEMLPCVYEESELPPPEPMRDLAAEIDEIKALLAPEVPPKSTHYARITAFNPTEVRPLSVVRNWNGQEYPSDCFVTQDIVDAYVAGKLSIGDFVLVHYDDIGEQIAMMKIFKTWG